MSESDSGNELKKKSKLTITEISWLFYDWANSVYATNVMAAIIPIFFISYAGGTDTSWAFGSSIATLIVAVLAPFLGAFADFKGMKKKFLLFFIIIGTSFTLMMAFTDNWKWMLVGYIVSYIGFTGANLFYDSFLTDVTTKERMDRISSYGYAMGYIGGSTIAFLISLAVMMVLGFDNPLGPKIAIIITTVWWALFSIPILIKVKQIHYIDAPKKGVIGLTLKNVWKTFVSLIKNRGVFLFLLAYFFYIDGVNTVIHMATSYGTTIGLDTIGLIGALLVTQVVAIPCTILFGKLAKRFGAMRMILAAVCMYVLICGVGFYMGYSIESAPASGINYDNAIKFSQLLFFLMAILVGTVQGGIQALSRSYFGKLIPPERSNEYFGFFDIFGKFAAVMGTALYGFISLATGSAANGIAGVSVLFIFALAVLILGRKIIKKSELDGGIK
jgi:UMF1 family MFS transporter